MLLITFAPVVSQLIAANAHGGELTAELCSAHAPAIEPAVSDARASATLDVPARPAVVVARVRGERPAPAFTTAQSRAPPVLV
jgi:hypothetical protein